MRVTPLVVCPRSQPAAVVLRRAGAPQVLLAAGGDAGLGQPRRLVYQVEELRQVSHHSLSIETFDKLLTKPHVFLPIGKILITQSSQAKFKLLLWSL